MTTKIDCEYDAGIAAKLFTVGGYVMLHHECMAGDKPHPDAGRIGQIVNNGEHEFMAQFFDDELIGSTTFCLIPRRHWAPVPDFCVETYEPRAKRKGWRLNERGVKTFSIMGWGRTPATEGKA